MDFEFETRRLVADLGGPAVVHHITGIARSTVYRWLSGESEPSISNLMTISRKAEDFRALGFRAAFRVKQRTARGPVYAINLNGYVK